MATQAFIVREGNLAGDVQLTDSLGLQDGQELHVISSNDRDILLRRSREAEPRVRSVDEVLRAWDAIIASMPPLPPRTPQWQQAAEERKRKATENLERVLADRNASATELKHAEKEWEFADDELDHGPFRER